MIDLGLTHAERKAFEGDLAQSHDVKLTVDLLDMGENELMSFTDTDVVMDGEVTFGARRQASVTVIDPTRKVALDPTHVWWDCMLSIRRHDYSASLGRWVTTPLFRGPLRHFEREGSEVILEALDKQVLLQSPAEMHETVTIRRGTRKDDAIRRIARARGETYFDLAGHVGKLHRHEVLHASAEPWRHMRKLAHSCDHQLFYDGRGRLRLRQEPDQPVFVLRQDAITGDVHETVDLSNLINQVIVIGAIARTRHPDQQGAGTQADATHDPHTHAVRAVATADRKHPLSPWRLGRGGTPLYLVERVHNEHVHRHAVAARIASRRLRHHLRLALGYELECLVVPHLEEHDIVRVEVAPGHYVNMPLLDFSIPLSPGGRMTVGGSVYRRLRKLRRTHRRAA